MNGVGSTYQDNFGQASLLARVQGGSHLCCSLSVVSHLKNSQHYDLLYKIVFFVWTCHVIVPPPLRVQARLDHENADSA